MVKQERATGNWSKLRSWKQTHPELRIGFQGEPKTELEPSEPKKEKNKVEVQLTRGNESV